MLESRPSPPEQDEIEAAKWITASSLAKSYGLWSSVAPQFNHAERGTHDARKQQRIAKGGTHVVPTRG